MPRIFDNIELSLLPALSDTLKISERADFCVGYFNLRGWQQIDRLIEAWPGGEGSCCRLIVGMPTLPQDELRQAFSLATGASELDAQAALRLRKRAAEEFRQQLSFGAPNNLDEAGLRRLSAQLKTKKVIVKLFLRHALHAKLYLVHRSDPRDAGMLDAVCPRHVFFSGMNSDLQIIADLEFGKAVERISQETQARIRAASAGVPRSGQQAAATLRIQLDAAEETCRVLSGLWIGLLERKNGGYLAPQDVTFVMQKVREVASSRKGSLIHGHQRGGFPASAAGEIARRIDSINAAIGRDLEIKIRMQQAFPQHETVSKELHAGIQVKNAANFGDEDRKFARQAIEEARKSAPEDDRVHPKVGVVVVKDGQVLAAAHRGEIPQCHAEYIALERKLVDVPLSGATVYTTLEPCTARNHPKVPCAIRLTDRKVARVVIGMLDPDKRIRGLGQMALRKARIATDFFQSDLMHEVEELNRNFMRDREINESHLPDPASSWKDSPTHLKIAAPPRVRVALKRGHVSNFLIEYANDEDEPIFIREARLFGGKDGKIELTEPLTPNDPSTWKVAPHSSMTFGKTIAHQRNPAASLVRMNSQKGIFFETEVVVIASCEMRGQLSEVRQTLYVKVNATNNEIVPLV
jgi:pyrimidine deaminase RibD-like protein